MKTTRKLFDISAPVGAESIVYPEDAPYSVELTESISAGGDCDVSAIKMGAHIGTHIDFPSHFFSDGKNANDFPIEKFVLPVHVIQIKDNAAIRLSEIKRVPFKRGDAILFKTANSTKNIYHNKKFVKDYVYLSSEAAEFIARKKPALVGIDYISIDKYGDDTYPAHRTLLKNNILILEGVFLRNVPEGKYTLICLPLKLKDIEAAPARAILVKK